MARIDWRTTRWQKAKAEKAKALNAEPKQAVETAEESVEKFISKKEEKVAPEVTTKPVSTDDLMKQMMQKMAQMEAELTKVKSDNAELMKKDENLFLKAREKYKWPRKYSYKLRGGVPVLSYVSKRRDPTKDWRYKNQFGQFESNHDLELSLADWTKVNVDVDDFWRDFNKSEFYEAEKVNWGFKFTSSEYWEFIVSDNIVN